MRVTWLFLAMLPPALGERAAQQYALEAQEGTRLREEETLDAVNCKEEIPQTKDAFNRVLAQLTESIGNRQRGSRTPGEDELYLQAGNNDIQRVCMLLHHYKPKPNLANNPPRGCIACTPLMRAAQRGYVKIAQALLAAGAPVDAEDEYGRTALLLAADNGNTQMIQALLAMRADVDKQDNDGETAMHKCTDGRVDGFRKILGNRPKPNLALKTRGSKGLTALESAKKREQSDCKRAIEQSR